MIDVILLVLRAAIVPLGFLVAALFFTDARSLVAGRFTTPSLSGSALFWFAGTSLSYQSAHFLGISATWRAALMVGTILALLLAVGAWRARLRMTPAQLDAIATNLPAALVMAELALVDREYSEELIGLMRIRIAERIVHNAR